MSDYVIETWNLTKQFNGKAGCKDISLQVPRGVVFGFLGPNGAGKSTFVRTLLGLLHPTSGRANILGTPIGNHRIRNRIGYLPELFRYQEWLTGYQLLKTHAALAKVPPSEWSDRINRLLDRVNLKGREHEKIRHYSKGMQQRIGIACALISDPEVIFFDEPTSALDPIGRKEIRDLMVDLKKEGKTIFLNSHLLSEVESVCDDVAIIHKSELVTQGNWRKLSAMKTNVLVRGHGIDADLIRKLHPLIRQATPVTEQDPLLQSWTIELSRSDDIPILVDRLLESGIRLYELTPKHPSLEEVFLYWVQRKEQEQRHVYDREVNL